MDSVICIKTQDYKNKYLIKHCMQFQQSSSRVLETSKWNLNCSFYSSNWAGKCLLASIKWQCLKCLGSGWAKSSQELFKRFKWRFGRKMIVKHNYYESFAFRTPSYHKTDSIWHWHFIFFFTRNWFLLSLIPQVCSFLSFQHFFLGFANCGGFRLFGHMSRLMGKSFRRSTRSVLCRFYWPIDCGCVTSVHPVTSGKVGGRLVRT